MSAHYLVILVVTHSPNPLTRSKSTDTVLGLAGGVRQTSVLIIYERRLAQVSDIV